MVNEPKSNVPDFLRSLTPEELAQVPVLTAEQIEESLELGRREAELAWQLRSSVIGRTIYYR